MATLCLLNSEGGAVRQWEIGERGVIIGRGATVDVQVEDDGLSRRHFMIVKDGDEYLLKDLSSRNGTWIGGMRQFSVRLEHQDRIIAGQSQFRFQDTVVQPFLGPHDTVVLSRANLAALDEMSAANPG